MMSEQPNEPSQLAYSGSLQIFQINLNKSQIAHLDLINYELSNKYELILVQEPHITSFNKFRTPPNFRPVFPISRDTKDDPIRSIIWVNRSLDTSMWTALDIPDNNDISAIQINNTSRLFSIFNIYNDCTHSRNKTALNNYITNNCNKILASPNHKMIWAGNFNRHHPLWDDDNDLHLFTQPALTKANKLINLLASYDMHMALPKGPPTLKHMVTKRYSRPDNVFVTNSLTELITICKVVLALKPPTTDHFPIITNIQLAQQLAMFPPFFNFKDLYWTVFRSKLHSKLNASPIPPQITHPGQIKESLNYLTKSIQLTIIIKPRPDAKQWWNSKLTALQKKLNKLRSISYKFRAIINHLSHSKLKHDSNSYGDTIVQAKRAHWEDFLENISAPNIWTANNFIKNPPGDGSQPWILSGDSFLTVRLYSKLSIFGLHLPYIVPHYHLPCPALPRPSSVSSSCPRNVRGPYLGSTRNFLSPQEIHLNSYICTSLI